MKRNARRPPNIVLTIADDQRGSALECMGVEPVFTPALDALAARGTHYVNAQHFGSCHGAVCSPSRAMLHTGHTYFDLDKSLLGETYHAPGSDPRIPPLLGERLQSVGYDCFGTGKWHNGVRSYSRSFNRGDNIFFGGMADHWFTPVHAYDETGQYPAQSGKVADGFSTEVFAQSAIDFIQSRQDDDAPFFCYCAFTAPHDPRTPPDYWRRRYDPRTIPLPPNIPISQWHRSSPRGTGPLFDTGVSMMRDEVLLGIPRDEAELKRALAEYYGMISHMDEWIGKIHRAVESIGELENTVVIHTADHGLAVGQHGLMGKQNLYQHSLHVPLIMAGPGIAPGLISETLCYQHDLNPTLLAYAGLEPDGDFFKPLDGQARKMVTSGFSDHQRSIRDKRYKLIEYDLEGGRRTELFDLENDPWESCNLFDDSGLEATIVSLRESMATIRAQANDPVSWFHE